jgi:hypothetical protein
MEVDIVVRIARFTGISPNFDLREADVPNAKAITLGENRYLLFNRAWLRKLGDGRTDWAATGILAHEVGHHLLGHVLRKDSPSRYPGEGQADKYSGFIMGKMGATLDQALIAVRSSALEAGSKTHPSRSERVQFVTAGWNEAVETSVIGATSTDVATAVRNFIDSSTERFASVLGNQKDSNGRYYSKYSPQGMACEINVDRTGMSFVVCQTPFEGTERERSERFYRDVVESVKTVLDGSYQVEERSPSGGVVLYRFSADKGKLLITVELSYYSALQHYKVSLSVTYPYS